MPAALAEAGVDYTLVDDSHFLTAGREIPELFGYYIAEECGKTVKVIPGVQELRYLLPFGSVEDSIAYLRRCASDHPGGMASMGDDMEKFGAWPHTYEHCFRDGWLERFFSAVEANCEWLEMVPPAEALAAHPPLGRVDLPTASYTEMMEWVLPTAVRQKFHSLLDEFSGRPDVRRFLRGGFWRGFFSKYAEANLLHKKMLRVSSKLRTGGARKAREKAPKEPSLRARAVTHLMRCAVQRCLLARYFRRPLRAAFEDGIVARISPRRDHCRLPRTRRQALSSHHTARFRRRWQGRNRDHLAQIRRPRQTFRRWDGEVLDFRPSAVTLINSLQRRVEAYHSRLQNAAQFAAKVASIHDQTLVKEPGLEKRLKYDRWARNAFRLLLFAPGKTHADYEALTLGEGAAFAGGDYQVEGANAEEITLSLEAPLRQVVAGVDADCILRVTKVLRFENREKGFDVRCRVELAPKRTAPPVLDSSGPIQFTLGLEMVINLLAPNVPDRYIEFAGERKPMEWSGVVEGQRVRLADEWQDVSVEIEASGASELWISPIETVSESEEGFERVYQGSQILGVWNVTLDPAQAWSAEAVLHVLTASNG